MADKAYVVGTFDTKSAELGYIADLIAATGLPVCKVDLSTGGIPTAAKPCWD